MAGVSHTENALNAGGNIAYLCVLVQGPNKAGQQAGVGFFRRLKDSCCKIAITLIDLVFGEQTAQACATA
jgi:hypothetical protein